MADPVPPGIRAVLLDLDDTLVPWQTLQHWQWAWKPLGPKLSDRHVLASVRHALHAWDRRRWQGLIGGAPPADGAAYRRHVAETLEAVAGRPLPAPEAEAVVARFLRPAGDPESFPDVAPALGRFAAAGVRIGAVTSLPEEAARHALKRSRLDLPLVGWADGPDGPGVPAAAAFRRAAAARDAKPRETYFVGDLFWSDVRAAARAGLRAALLDRREFHPRVQAARLKSLAEELPLGAETEPDGPDDATGPA